MNCNIVKDLLPLYIDSCCCEESKDEIEKHLCDCPNCRDAYENMKGDVENYERSECEPKKFRKINLWKASVIQSCLLFFSFALITAGVALEASTPTGWDNGGWAYSLVVPATGFMLSLANWYFVRLYKSTRLFSDCCALLCFFITLCAGIWTGFHYGFTVFDYLSVAGTMSLTDFFESLPVLFFTWGYGAAAMVLFCILSKFTSKKYAQMLGKQ